jgi:hypothetical protein
VEEAVGEVEGDGGGPVSVHGEAVCELVLLVLFARSIGRSGERGRLTTQSPVRRHTCRTRTL